MSVLVYNMFSEYNNNMYKHDFALYIKLLNFAMQFESLNALLIGLVHSRIHNNNIMSIYVQNGTAYTAVHIIHWTIPSDF